jgi:hypothetical protein
MLVKKPPFLLHLVGPFDDKEYFNEMKNLEGWKNVEYLGVLPHKELEEKVYSKQQ